MQRATLALSVLCSLVLVCFHNYTNAPYAVPLPPRASLGIVHVAQENSTHVIAQRVADAVQRVRLLLSRCNAAHSVLASF